eukprot:TRINITY_DN45708_c0_g2_i1.p1 TRINITY_DN45708_c0_g2~~TRINITY_DN45708_c0_g2_i1.p1  ORF type:complete len:583 (-),score=162.57 TRINITY_DN45708_c0_g2_i1:110-1858(-)
MGDVLAKLFVNLENVPEDGYGFIQVLFLGGCYLYILLIGANMIGDGSELLMLVPSIAGVVGSVVLPVLGAVPDGAIVLFSGLGEREKAMSQVAVGVGALAGSTVMLLTIPWFLSIMGGGVPMINGQPQYSKRSSAKDVSVFQLGVVSGAAIRKSAMVMLVTMLTYLIVEIPALVLINEDKTTEADDLAPFAWAGTVVCFVLFVAYIVLQYRAAQAGPEESSGPAETEFSVVDQMITDTTIKAIDNGKITLRGALFQMFPSGRLSVGMSEPLTQATTEEQRNQKLKAVVRPFFKRLDTDNSGNLTRDEMKQLTHVLGEYVEENEFETFFTRIDTSGDGTLSFDEFCVWTTELLKRDYRQTVERAPRPSVQTSASPPSGAPVFQGRQVAENQETQEEEEEDDDDEECEIPEDLSKLTPEEQQRRILQRALYQMGVGTLIVLLFSDPMCDVLDALGTRTGINPFFVAFLLGPVASNASEMVASYKYAQKKTKKTIAVAFSQLIGAACMNNTFCLFIFYLLIAARKFPWTYHAEVAGIIFVEVVMGVVASRPIHTFTSGLIVLSLLPLSLVMVAVLKATVFSSVEG